MILRVRCFGRWKKKLWKSNEKLKLKPDMHIRWMFDWFWIDFQSISGSLWAKTSLRKSLGMNFGIILSLFWDHGRALERWREAWCWKIALRTRGTWRRTSILNSKMGLRASWKLPKAFPKASQIERKLWKGTIINELINFICLKEDFWWVWMPKWWFVQTSFEDQIINCKQMPRVQKHAKTNCFVDDFEGSKLSTLKEKVMKN